jgi:hypothetical protein
VEALAEFSQDELMKYGVNKAGWRKKLLGRARKEYAARSVSVGGGRCAGVVCLCVGGGREGWYVCVCVCGGVNPTLNLKP